MAPMFVSEDIDALISAFPPSPPSKDCPALLRSASGSSFLDSGKVMARFQTIYEDRTGRIKIKDLPALLGVENIDWLSDSYDGPLRYSFDGHSILTRQAWQRSVQHIHSATQHKYIDILTLAKESDISFEVAADYVKGWNTVLRGFEDERGPLAQIVTYREHVEYTKTRIIALMSSARHERVDLSERLSDVPRFIVSTLVTEVRDTGRTYGGEIEETGGDVIFVPSSYHVYEYEERREGYMLEVDGLVGSLVQVGFCRLPEGDDGSLEQDVRDKLAEQSDMDLETFTTADGRIILTLKSTSEAIKTHLCETIESLVEQTARLDPAKLELLKLDSEMQATLAAKSSNTELANVLLQSHHRQKIEHALWLALGGARMASRRDVESLYQKTLSSLLRLYTDGLFEDPVLKEHQEAYLFEYFRTDVVPKFMESARPHGGHGYLTSLPKDLDELAQRCSQSRILDELRTAVVKFAKKQDFEEAEIEDWDDVKQDFLIEKAKTVQEISRASDVLQNLLWILLAAERDGLYMSAEKDSSRMIKQYQLIGDEAIGKKLEEWKDSLQVGKESKQDVQEMKQLALRTVEENMNGMEPGTLLSGN